MEEDDFKAPKGSLEHVLDGRGFHILACDCGARNWLVIIRKEEEGVLRVFCGLCNSFSGPMVPKDEQDRKLLTEAAEEVQNRKEEDAWSKAVPDATKKGRGNLN